MQLAASILSADFARLGEEANNVLAAGADVIHFDVMDHHFVPNLSFGAIICKALRNAGISALIDVHLMVTDPEAYIEPFANAGANRLTFHPETVSNTAEIALKIRNAGMQAGLAFNPDKPVLIDKDTWPLLNMILLMSVFPGFGGQQFIPESLEKVTQTKQTINAHNADILLGIDGGIKASNIKQVVDAGANFVVMGSGIFDAKDYRERIKLIHESLEKAC